MCEVIVLIPNYNEEKSLLKLIKKIKYKIIVIDDCSKDNSFLKLKKKKIETIRNNKRLGYEATLINGFNYIKKKYKKCSYILTMDADGEHPPENISSILNFIKKKKCDVVIGSRFKLNRFSEYVLSFFFQIKYSLPDPLSGFKIYRSNLIFKNIKKIKKKFFLIDLITYLSKYHRVLNMNIRVKKRSNSSSKVGGIIKSNLKILSLLKVIL